MYKLLSLNRVLFNRG